MKILIILKWVSLSIILTLFAASEIAFASSAETPTSDLFHSTQQHLQVSWSHSVSASILINAPVQKVWEYVSNSKNAVEWSVYFDHISPLRSDAKDGEIGSVRRCFRNRSETGKSWDEMTIEVTPEKSRTLRVFNYQGFGIPSATIPISFVKQSYEVQSNGQTRLTFETSRNVVSWLSSRRTKTLFEKNLANIKQKIENGPFAPRIFEWEPDFHLLPRHN